MVLASLGVFLATACSTSTSPPPEERPPIPLPPRMDEEPAEKPEPVFEGTLVDGSCVGLIPVDRISIAGFPTVGTDESDRCRREEPDKRTILWTCDQDDGTTVEQHLIKKGEPRGGYQAARLIGTRTRDGKIESSCIYEGRLKLALMTPTVEDVSEVDPGLWTNPYPFEPETVVLRGTLRSEERWGPPNYGETPEQDAIVAVWVLRLPEPITAGTPSTLSEVNTKPVPDVTEVQVQFAEGVEPEPGPVEVTGKLGVKTTGADYLDVVLRESTLRN